uniref:Uracil-DNA glycosylase n=1 Tax=Albugo laibachii Nc14 TaxID=890382 RepID=F0W832_9STRA|nr:uracilDNA glycosylase putative [Albugo laibachii Nc14]|eukprot:CCA17285.1 uracilDNA glycosylase putative [Albugo laibachii Nc14]
MQDIRSYFTAGEKQRKKQKTAVEQTIIKSTVEVKKPSSLDEPQHKHSGDVTYQALESCLKDLMHPTWYALLESECQKDYFQKLLEFLRSETVKHTLYPLACDVFSSLRDCPFDALKVVIIGQDPYHGPNQAHGLCFSIQNGVQVPPSLRNIINEAIEDVHITKPTHGCLISWCQQGILLLNAVMTVRKGEANSHCKKGWERWTDTIIRFINDKTTNTVFLLWGRQAQDKCSIIDTKKHCVIKTSHPSPLGAAKTNAPFLGSRCFSRANSYLIEHDKEPINWNIL